MNIGHAHQQNSAGSNQYQHDLNHLQSSECGGNTLAKGAWTSWGPTFDIRSPARRRKAGMPPASTNRWLANIQKDFDFAKKMVVDAVFYEIASGGSAENTANIQRFFQKWLVKHLSDGTFA